MEASTDTTARVVDDDLVLIAFSALKRHGRRIVAATAVVTALALLAGGARFWTQRAERQSSVVFQLAFAGADKGHYPNELPFQPADIIGTTVLDAAYDRNDLVRACARDAFRRAFLIASVPPPSRLLYRVSMARGACRSVSDAAAAKVLTDVLSLWAEDASSKPGVLKLRVPPVGVGVFDEVDAATPLFEKLTRFVAALDQAIGNVRQIRGLSGADAFRPKQSMRTFRDIEVALRDLEGVRLDAALAAGGDAVPPDVARWIAHELQDRQQLLDNAHMLAQVYLTALRAYGGPAGSDRAAEFGQSLAQNYIQQSLAGFEAQQEVDRFKALGGRRVAGGSDRAIAVAVEALVTEAKDTVSELDTVAELFERTTAGSPAVLYSVAEAPRSETLQAFSLALYVALVCAAFLGTLALGLVGAILYDQFLLTPTVER